MIEGTQLTFLRDSSPTYDDGGYYFDTRGKRKGTSFNAEQYRSLSPMLLVLESQITSLIPRACGCEHEYTIARTFPTQQEFLSSSYNDVLACLCPEGIRGENPNCAHRASDLNPEPFGPELHELAQHRVIDPRSWYRWYKKMIENINDIDIAISDSSRERLKSMQLDAEKRRWMQEENIRELLRMQNVLRKGIQSLLTFIAS